MLENKKVNCDFGGPFGMEVHYSRLIASWKNAGGERYAYLFEDWLKSLGLNDSDVRACYDMYITGKFEAEQSVRKWLEEHKHEYD